MSAPGDGYTWDELVRRLGRYPAGETWHKDDGLSETTAAARGIFLAFVAELAPQAVRDLLDRCLLPYCQAVASPGDGELDAALDGWASDWNLDEPWVRTWARRVLSLAPRVLVARVDESGEEIEAGPPWSSILDLEISLTPLSDFRLRVGAWDPEREGWEGYRDRVRREFDTELTRYHEAAVQELGASGYSRTPGKRSTIGPPDLHFRWLVRWQVLGETQAAIQADPLGDGSEALESDRKVREAIHQTAALIGLKRYTEES